MIQFDLTDVYKWEKRITEAPDQIRFAAARSLNDAVDYARSTLIEDTWPKHVQVKDSSFLKTALTTKGERANKSDLTATLYDRLGRAHLSMHEMGGTKRPARSNLAIPSDAVTGRRGARGVPLNLRPQRLQNSFRLGDIIYQRTGGKNRRNKGLRLMYVLKSSVPIKGNVPFHRDFEAAVTRQMQQSFPKRFAEAVASRRR
jgi:hypothetical protein